MKVKLWNRPATGERYILLKDLVAYLAAQAFNPQWKTASASQFIEFLNMGLNRVLHEKDNK
jgi:hypothetical protein